MRLYLVRHPKPLVGAGICYGVSDVKCSGQELESVASSLLQQLPRGLQIISSTLSRCEHLAQILCRREPSFAYKTDQKIAEMDFGAWEMQAWDCVARDELEAWTDAFATFRCGGTGESTRMFVQRVAQHLHDSSRSGEDQIWITHAGVIRAVQWLSGQSWERFTALLDPEPQIPLRAADWPKGEVAFGRVQVWDWPPSWRKAR